MIQGSFHFIGLDKYIAITNEIITINPAENAIIGTVGSIKAKTPDTTAIRAIFQALWLYHRTRIIPKANAEIEVIIHFKEKIVHHTPC